MGTKKELSEKDFIHEEFPKHPYTILGWLAAIAAFTFIIWGGLSLYTRAIEYQYSHSPFLRVTNREMSLFLWQNPSFMRVNAKNKNSYLPAFQYAEKIGLNPEYAEDYVIAPPEVLFYYHTWHRLIGNEFPQRAISIQEFQSFLAYAEEWQPRYWPQAPEGYVKLVKELPNLGMRDLNELPDTVLPLIVRQAFIGWKNFMKEGHEINEMSLTYKDMAEFINAYPHYAHNYWCNIIGASYLKDLYTGDYREDEIVPTFAMAPFLKAAIYSFLHQPRGTST